MLHHSAISICFVINAATNVMCSQNQHLSPEERQRLEEESKPWYQRYMWYIIIGLAVMFLMPSAPDAASDKAAGGAAAGASGKGAGAAK